nr:glutaredoxin domain-containing protein [Caenimonas sedimenti]
MAALVGLLAAASFGAGAQQVYRIIGPDGKVTFSDKPPPAATAKAGTAPGGSATASAGGGGSGLGALPFELRNVATKYPVTLYTGPECGPCVAGRGFLDSRGIPYTERTVSTADDIDALKRLAGAARLPFLTIGSQQLRGFSDAEWSSFLDAAGYPKSSQLPSGFRRPAAAPLVAVQAPPQPTAAAAGQAAQNEPAAAATTAAPADPPANPSGIRF